MGKVLAGVDELPRSVPDGVVQARINLETGLRDPEGRGFPDYFYQEFLPAGHESGTPRPQSPGAGNPPDDVKSQLF